MFAQFWKMLARLCQSRGARILGDLKAYAKTGDMNGFKAAMREWDTVQNVRWAKLSMLELSLQCHDDVPDEKAVVLHRVLTTAAEAGQVDIARCLIKQHGCIVCPSAVRAAFDHEQWDILELFLEQGWDINSAVLGNNTHPILKEVITSEVKSRWCLDHGADPLHRTAAKNSDVASIAGCWAPVSVIKLLKERGVDFAKTDALQQAAEGRHPGRVEVMTYLINEAGFPINQIELEFLPQVYLEFASNGLGTALHSAVKCECEETLKFLLESGADRDKPDANGKKPIDIAREKGFKAGVTLLERRKIE